MELLIYLPLLVLVFVVVQKIIVANRGGVKVPKDSRIYQYGRKEYIMTKAEYDFFLMLNEVLRGDYHVFPQVHLSSLLDEKAVKGQNWDAAFRHINGKSVDFVVCDRRYAKPLVAIELDDSSHDNSGRKIRDEEVERIFATANLPLLRFSGHENLSIPDIEDRLRQVLDVKR